MDNTDINEAFLTHEKNLEEIYFKLLHARDLIKEEIKTIEPKVDKLSQTTSLFVAHFDDFQKLSERAQVTLKQSITAAAASISQQTTEHIDKSIHVKIESSLRALQLSTSKLEEILKAAKVEGAWRNAIIIGISLISAVIAGASTGYYFTHKFDHLTSPHALKTFEYGKILVRVWPRLSQKEKDNLINLSKYDN